MLCLTLLVSAAAPSLARAETVVLPNGRALETWAQMRGYRREEVMAIGDNMNDLEMLEFAGVAVVMGNSVPELQRFGWLLTGTNDEAGVATAIEKYALAPE